MGEGGGQKFRDQKQILEAKLVIGNTLLHWPCSGTPKLPSIF